MNDNLPNAVQQLLDEQAILKLMTRWCRAVDRADIELLRTCYHPDSTNEHGPFKGTTDELMEFYRTGILDASKRPGPMQHSISNLTLDIHGDTAYGELYMEGRSVDAEGQLQFTVGRYVDRYERRNGEWRIIRGSTVIEYGGSNYDMSDPAHASWIQGSRDRTDPSYARLPEHSTTPPSDA